MPVPALEEISLPVAHRASLMIEPVAVSEPVEAQ
jgi:hypothetical protein